MVLEVEEGRYLQKWLQMGRVGWGVSVLTSPACAHHKAHGPSCPTPRSGMKAPCPLTSPAASSIAGTAGALWGQWEWLWGAGVQTGPERGKASGEQWGLSLCRGEWCGMGGWLDASFCLVVACEKGGAGRGITWALGLVFGKGQRLLQEPLFPIFVLAPILLSTASALWSAGSWQEGW